MTRLILLAALALSACTNGAPVDLCKNAPVRRAVYTSAITAADTYAASGRPVPAAVAIGREAAVTALAVLDANCPVVRP